MKKKIIIINLFIKRILLVRPVESDSPDAFMESDKKIFIARVVCRGDSRRGAGHPPGRVLQKSVVILIHNLGLQFPGV